MPILKCIVLLCLPLQVFASSSDSLIVQDIIVEGNAKTDLSIILRELSFKPGDVIADWPGTVQENTQRLLNLFLFNEVKIERNGNRVIIQVKERLYVWPKIDCSTADRNFNQWWLSKDLKRLNLNTQLGIFNIKGQNKSLWLRSQLGYTTALSLTFKQPYINAKKTIGIQAQLYYSANKEIWIQTANDKLQFYSANNQTMIKRLGAEAWLLHRPKIYTYHAFGMGFRHIGIADSAVAHQGNNPYLWQGLSSQKEFNLAYQLSIDKRNLKGFPTKGFLIKAQCDWNTLGGQTSSLHYWQLKGSAAKYWPIREKVFASIGVAAKYVNFEYLPYNKFQSLGYGKDYIRGYELYVVDGHAFAIAKAEFKWRILQKTYKFLPKVKHYESLPTQLFFTVFNDCGYVSNVRSKTQPDGNQLPNQWLYGFGAGVNVVMYTDYCTRLEYSTNHMGGSRWYLSFVTAF